MPEYFKSFKDLTGCSKIHFPPDKSKESTPTDEKQIDFFRIMYSFA